MEENEEINEDGECQDLENKDFSVELEGFPHVLKYIQKLQEQIKVQKSAIVKLSGENKVGKCNFFFMQLWLNNSYDY